MFARAGYCPIQFFNCQENYAVFGLLVFQADQAGPDRIPDQARNVVNVQSLHQQCPVSLNRLGADLQHQGDGLGWMTFSH